MGPAGIVNDNFYHCSLFCFRQSLSSGVDHGLQVAVYHEGQLVVELAGGYADEEAHWEMQKDTLLFSAAVTQAVAAVVIAMLVDK